MREVKVIYQSFTCVTWILLKRRPAEELTGSHRQLTHVPQNFLKHSKLMSKTRKQGETHQMCEKVMHAKSHPQRKASGMAQISVSRR